MSEQGCMIYLLPNKTNLEIMVVDKKKDLLSHPSIETFTIEKGGKEEVWQAVREQFSKINDAYKKQYPGEMAHIPVNLIRGNGDYSAFYTLDSEKAILKVLRNY